MHVTKSSPELFSLLLVSTENRNLRVFEFEKLNDLAIDALRASSDTTHNGDATWKNVLRSEAVAETIDSSICFSDRCISAGHNRELFLRFTLSLHVTNSWATVDRCHQPSVINGI